MKKLMIGIVAAALLPLSAPAMAKDICVDAAFGKFYFKSVPAIKPKAILALRGIFIQSGIDVPVYGTISVRTDGAIRYSVTVPAPQSSYQFQMDVTATDKTLAGSGTTVQFSNAGTFNANPVTLTSIDCKDVIRP